MASSLIRIFGTVKGGLQIINLSKTTSIELYKTDITITYDRKFPISGNFLWFSGGYNISETYSYKTEENARKDFDSMHEILNNYYKK
jgi:hypothetical protein